MKRRILGSNLVVAYYLAKDSLGIFVRGISSEDKTLVDDLLGPIQPELESELRTNLRVNILGSI
ncbi:MAG: hypothetical protein R3D32_09045 [Nitratireductor sp.]